MFRRTTFQRTWSPKGGGVATSYRCTLAAPRFKFHIFDHRIPCEFLRKSFMPRIRFVGLILAKIVGVKVWKTDTGWASSYNSYFVLQYASLQVCRYASMQVCKYASMPVCNYVSMQVCKYANLQICGHASMQVCKYASVQVCRYASMQVGNVLVLAYILAYIFTCIHEYLYIRILAYHCTM